MIFLSTYKTCLVLSFSKRFLEIKDALINNYMELYFKFFFFIAAFRIHLILTWIRILGSTFGKSGYGSSDPPFRNSGSGFSFTFYPT